MIATCKRCKGMGQVDVIRGVKKTPDGRIMEYSQARETCAICDGRGFVQLGSAAANVKA